MPAEIERKFLVADHSWRLLVRSSEELRQGYLSEQGRATVRVRRAGAQGFLTIKGEGGLVRSEYEYPIPPDHAEAMLDELCRKPLIEKTRHSLLVSGLVWTVDEFRGALAPLVLAEVELDRPDQMIDLPSWAGREVTGDPAYQNANLARL